MLTRPEAPLHIPVTMPSDIIIDVGSRRICCRAAAWLIIPKVKPSLSA